MDATLESLTHKLDELLVELEIARHVLDVAEADDSEEEAASHLHVVARALRTSVRSHVTSYRVNVYASIIVGLYGALEQFIEESVESSVTRRAAIAHNYTDLSESLRRAHLDLSLEVLRRRDETKYLGQVSPDRMIQRLHNCNSGSPDFAMNSEVFAHHTANFRHGLICETFARCDVDLAGVDDARGLTALLDSSFAGRSRYDVIDDLAQRRNEISHGVVSETLSIPVCRAYVEVIRSYCSAVAAAVVESLASFAIDQHGLPLGQPSQVFDNRVACFESCSQGLSIGSTVGIRRNGRSLVSTVGSVQVDGLDRESVQSGEDIGLTTGFRSASNMELYVLPASLSDLNGTSYEIPGPFRLD